MNRSSLPWRPGETPAPDLVQQRGLRNGFLILAILMGALQAAANWNQLSSTDTVSYLDIGDAYFRCDWKNAINASWSPFYSWCLGLAMFVLRPSPFWEFAVVKAVNFLLFLFCLACFDFFLRQMIEEYEAKSGIPSRTWIIGGYTLFLWSALYWTGVDTTTPDMAASGLLYLAAGIVLRKASWLKSVMLGTVLGLGYLSKAPVLPVAFVFIAAFFPRNGLPRTLLAALFFVLFAGPFVAALSIQKGHLTFGEKGKLSYAWFVNPKLPDLHWQGGIHPTRKILEDPPTYEFAIPVNGTYPPWYDPSYWYEGVSFQFNAGKQTHSLVRNLHFLWSQFLATLAFGYFLLLWMSGSARGCIRALPRNWRLLLPAVAGLGLYALVSDMPAAYFESQPNTRHFAPYAVLLFTGVFASMRSSTDTDSKRFPFVLCSVACLLVAIILCYRGMQDLMTIAEPAEHTAFKVAAGAMDLGIQPQDRIATIGKESDHVFWARLARVKMIAESPYPGDQWNSNRLIAALRNTGADAIVMSAPSLPAPAPWKRIGSSNYYLYSLKQHDVE